MLSQLSQPRHCFTAGAAAAAAAGGGGGRGIAPLRYSNGEGVLGRVNGLRCAQRFCPACARESGVPRAHAPGHTNQSSSAKARSGMVTTPQAHQPSLAGAPGRPWMPMACPDRSPCAQSINLCSSRRAVEGSVAGVRVVTAPSGSGCRSGLAGCCAPHLPDRVFCFWSRLPSHRGRDVLENTLDRLKEPHPTSSPCRHHARPLLPSSRSSLCHCQEKARPALLLLHPPPRKLPRAPSPVPAAERHPVSELVGPALPERTSAALSFLCLRCVTETAPVPASSRCTSDITTFHARLHPPLQFVGLHPE